MAKTSSKKQKKSSTKRQKKDNKFFAKLKKLWIVRATTNRVAKIKKWRSERVRLHKSFRRSYREDYARPIRTPGLLSHAVITFKTIFKHWKKFVPLILIMLVSYILLVGIMNEDTYKQFQESIDEQSEALANGQVGNFARAGLLLLSTVTTGGLDPGTDDVGTVFTVILFLVIWLVTIFLLRHIYADKTLKLRDALYNALGPIISTLLVFVVVCIQAIPIMLVAITYSAAVNTGFLSTPFYALIYFIFAALMCIWSVYMLSSSLIALIAVTAPGVYPMAALGTASDLIAGRRTHLVIRILYLVFVVAFIYAIVMLPIILLDLLLKSAWDFLASWPIVPFFLIMTTCLVFIYIAAYLYRYYRWHNTQALPLSWLVHLGLLWMPIHHTWDYPYFCFSTKLRDSR